MTLLDAGPLSDAALSAVPQTATLAGAGRFDLARLVDVVRQVAGDIDPDAGAMIDAGLSQWSDMIKTDLRKDLLASLGDEWAYYTDPTIGGRGLAGFVVVNHLRDPAKAAASLAAVETFANAQLAKSLENEKIKVQVYTTKRGGLTIHYLGTPLISPAWAIQDGNLYVALFPQVVSAAADHVAGKGKSILDNPDFVALRKRLGGEKACGVSFMDLPRTAPDAYAQWVMISRLSGFADLFGVKSPAMLLPPLNKLLPQLTPAGSVTWVDKDGWHMSAVSPFPCATALSTEPLGALLALQPLGMAVALPALSRAREQAVQAKSMSNLRQIGIAGVMYANADAKTGRFPASLGEIGAHAGPHRGGLYPPRPSRANPNPPVQQARRDGQVGRRTQRLRLGGPGPRQHGRGGRPPRVRKAGIRS